MTGTARTRQEFADARIMSGSAHLVLASVGLEDEHYGTVDRELRAALGDIQQAVRVIDSLTRRRA